MSNNATVPAAGDGPGTRVVCHVCGADVPVIAGRVAKHFREIPCRASGRPASDGQATS